jgi:hypothetical protein
VITAVKSVTSQALGEPGSDKRKPGLSDKAKAEINTKKVEQ